MEADVTELWDGFKRDGDMHRRDQLILHYSPLVKYVAGRLSGGLPQRVEQADLVGWGVFGLIDAIDKFEPERGIKFETYAMTRIKGAILDGLRSIDWAPRSVRAKARAIEGAMATHSAKLHRAPSEAELAVELDLTTEQLQDALLKISFVGVAQLDQALPGSGEREDTATLADTVPDQGPGPVALFEVTEMRNLLADAVDALTEREQMVLGLYYYEDLTLSEIGGILGVTESRVCQLHTRAVLRLRANLRHVDPNLRLPERNGRFRTA
jgi:RNA polymerase sigma factor for flagellar operon FliA